MKCKENMKVGKGAVTFAYSSAEATILHLDVKPTQTIKALGMGCCFAFTISQVE